MGRMGRWEGGWTIALEGKNNPHYFIPQGKPGVSSLLFLVSLAQIAENSGRRGKVKRRNDNQKEDGPC